MLKYKQDLPKAASGLASKLEPAAPWQLVMGYVQYRNQLNSLNRLLDSNHALPPLANLKDESGDAPRTLVLVIGESTQRGRMSCMATHAKPRRSWMRCIKAIRG